MTDTQDRLEERLTRVETTLNNARPVEGSRVAAAFWVDDITALLAALRQSQDIEAAALELLAVLEPQPTTTGFNRIIPQVRYNSAVVHRLRAALAPKEGLCPDCSRNVAVDGHSIDCPRRAPKAEEAPR